MVGLAVLTGFALQSTAHAYDAEQASYQSVADMEHRLAELETQLRSVEQASYQSDGTEDSYLPPDPTGATEPNYMPNAGAGNCDSCNGGSYCGGGCCPGGGCSDGYCDGSYCRGNGCGVGGYGGCCNNGYYDGCGSCGMCDGVYGACGCSGYGCGDCGCEPSCGCDGGYCDCSDGYGYEPGCGCDDGCGGWGGCRGGSWVYSGEFLMLRPQNSEADRSQKELQSGSRFTLGYTTLRDQTVRARYFEYEATKIDGDEFLKLEMLDLEYAGGFNLGRSWTGEIGAGLRWAKFDEEFEYRYADSFGPEIGIELQSNPWRCTSVFASVRQSLQFGHPREYSGSSFARTQLGSFAVTEMQIGLQWQRMAYRGNTLFCRGTLEAQDWSGVSATDSEDQRLIGWGVTVGITR